MTGNHADTHEYVKPRMLGIVLSVVIVYIVSYFTRVIYTAFFGPLSKFPGPKLRKLSKLPGIYTTIKGRDAFVRAALHQTYGPVVRVNPTELSFNGGAEAWEAIYGFKKPKPFRDPLFYSVGVNGCPDVVSADEANHSRQRKIISTGFSDKSLKEFEPLLKAWAQTMMIKMAEQAKAKGTIDMLKYLNCTTFDIMGDLTFGQGLDMLEDGELSPWVKTIFAGFKAGTFWREVRNYSRITDWMVSRVLFNSEKVRVMMWENFQYCQSRMDARLAREPSHPDLWSRILVKSDDSETLTRDEFHSNAVTLMVAGTETTASALSGLVYLLHREENGDALRKLKEEVRSSFSSPEMVTLDSLARLKYMHAVIQEGLRIYPPAPSQLPRRTPSEGMMVCDYFVPGDVTIGVHPLATFRSPKHFKNSFEFHPERWLGDTNYETDHLDAVEPFSFGPQNCLGRSFAWHEMRVLLASIIICFDIELADEARDWMDQNTYTLWEKKPLPCTLRESTP